MQIIAIFILCFFKCFFTLVAPDAGVHPMLAIPEFYPIALWCYKWDGSFWLSAFELVDVLFLADDIGCEFLLIIGLSLRDNVFTDFWSIHFAVVCVLM